MPAPRAVTRGRVGPVCSIPVTSAGSTSSSDDGDGIESAAEISPMPLSGDERYYCFPSDITRLSEELKYKNMVIDNITDELHRSRQTITDLQQRISQTNLGPDGHSIGSGQRAFVQIGLVFAIFAAVLGMFQFGYNTGVINAPLDQIEHFIEQVYTTRYGGLIKPTLRTFLSSVVVALFAIGGMIGGISGGVIANRCGRKGGLLLNQVSGIIGAVLMGFSQYSLSFEMLIFGRLIIGFNCGLNTILVPMYISEISTASLRGGLGTVNQLAVTIGLLLSMVLGIEPILGSSKGWPWLLGISVCPPLLQLMLLPCCPESPRYLLINLNKEEEARKALWKLRSSSDVEADIEEMRAEEIAQQAEARISVMELIKSKTLRLPLIIAVVMQLSQQLSGINAVFYYSTPLFEKAGIEINAAKYCTIGVGVVMVVMTVISIPLMDRAGRRTLHLYGLGGMFIFSIFITISLLVKFIISWLSYLAVISVLCYVVFFAIGPGSIPWMITAELFSQGPRPAAMSIAVLINWFANFIVGISFKTLQSAFENYTFLPYTVLLAIFWTFTYKKVPETKGKTFEEIAAYFKRGQAPETPETVTSSGLKEDTEFSEYKSDFLHSHHGEACYSRKQNYGEITPNHLEEEV